MMTVVLLIGCTSDVTTELKGEVESLKEQKRHLSDTNKQLENEVKKNKSTIEELEKENNLLIDLLEEGSTSFESEITIHDEGFFIDPTVVFYDSLTIEQIKKVMGEPKQVRDYIEEAHCGCQETEVTYENASFTFQGELLKWMTLKDSTLVTQRGITIGSSKDQVLDVYGDNFYSHENGEINYGEKTGVRFSFKDNFVSEIKIWYMYE